MRRSGAQASRSYPVCLGGRWAGPPQDCGGPQEFLQRRAAAPRRVRELLGDLIEDIKVGDTEALDYRFEELQPWQEWLMLHAPLGIARDPLGSPRIGPHKRE